MKKLSDDLLILPENLRIMILLIIMISGRTSRYSFACFIKNENQVFTRFKNAKTQNAPLTIFFADDQKNIVENQIFKSRFQLKCVAFIELSI